MAKEIFLEIDRKKVALTPEQIKVLGLEEKTTPFKRSTGKYFYINDTGKIFSAEDDAFLKNGARHDVANYCTDKSLMQHRALHETLNRLLWRFSMENEGDKIDWKSEKSSSKWHIYFDEDCGCYKIDYNMCLHYEGTIYFYTKEIAQKAIDEIVLPFMEKNPGFVW